jgi:hypothetical protein
VNPSSLLPIVLANLATGEPYPGPFREMGFLRRPAGRIRLRPRGSTKSIETKTEARARKKSERQRRKAGRR